MFERYGCITFFKIDDFMLFDPPSPFSLILAPSLVILCVLESINYLGMEFISLKLLHINLYYTVEKFKHSNWMMLGNLGNLVQIWMKMDPNHKKNAIFGYLWLSEGIYIRTPIVNHILQSIKFLREAAHEIQILIPFGPKWTQKRVYFADHPIVR